MVIKNNRKKTHLLLFNYCDILVSRVLEYCDESTVGDTSVVSIIRVLGEGNLRSYTK